MNVVETDVVEGLDAEAREAVGELIARIERETGHAPLADNKVLEMRGAVEPTGFAVRATEEGELLGYAHAARPEQADPAVWNVQTVVDPDAFEGHASGLFADLTEQVVTEARSRTARRIRWFAVEATTDHDDLARRLGLERWRELVNLRRPLPVSESPTLPAGVTIRPFKPGDDDDAWVEVNRQAFADHPEQRNQGLDALHALMAEPWFDVGDFLVADDADGLAGFCWCKLPLGADHGEIYVIGTDPQRRGRGLGRALVLAGLARMHERGRTTATLYTDGDNVTARRLYESLGFTLDHVDVVYAGEGR